MNLAVAIAKKLEIKNFEDIRWKMIKVYDILKPTKLHRKVICHGDLWYTNLMFENNQPSHCIFVDFQLIRYAPLVLDFLQLVYVNNFGNITEDLKIKLLKHYHNALQEIIGKNRSIDAKIPSFKEVLESCNHYEYYGKIMAMLILRRTFNLVYISNEDLNDAKILIRAIFHSMNTNEKFKNQMKILINNILNI